MVGHIDEWIQQTTLKYHLCQAQCQALGIQRWMIPSLSFRGTHNLTGQNAILLNQYVIRAVTKGREQWFRHKAWLYRLSHEICTSVSQPWTQHGFPNLQWHSKSSFQFLPSDELSAINIPPLFLTSISVGQILPPKAVKQHMHLKTTLIFEERNMEVV